MAATATTFSTGGAGNDTLDGRAGKDILNGGAGNDTLNFYQDSTWGRRGSRRTNAGSPDYDGCGERVSIKGMRQSQDIFNGGAGIDTLVGTRGADAILLDDTRSGAQQSGPRLSGIEIINAGAGDDVVDLTSSRYSYGDVTIDGGSGNDVLWSSRATTCCSAGPATTAWTAVPARTICTAAAATTSHVRRQHGGHPPGRQRQRLR